MNLARARAVADAVMYEGYLLYPYRRSSEKNRSRWQFGVLGPPGAAAAGIGEDSSMAVQFLIRAPARGTGRAAQGAAELIVRLRFLQLQRRQVYDNGAPVDEVRTGAGVHLSWEEAIEREVAVPLDPGCPRTVEALHVDGGADTEPLEDTAWLVRCRWPITAELTARSTRVGDFVRIEVRVDNTGPVPSTREDAVRTSLLGAHLLVEAYGMSFVSLLEPPDDATAAAAGCAQHRCWPVLVGEPGETDLLLGSPIILYDYPAVAPESTGALFDATEIDEILSLRVMTMTEAEKAEARASDPRAADIIDRCDALSPEELQRLHGVLRDPRSDPLRHATTQAAPSAEAEADPPARWWDPEADATVDPEADWVDIGGQRVGRGSRVRVQPRRRADAHDLFFADQLARVQAVLRDVDGGTHLALVMEADPAADLHEWFGRYLYFDPDEVEPLDDPIESQPPGPGGQPERREGHR
jgi:hypothetical protein